MEGLQIDLTLIVALWMGAAVALVPLLALAARFAVLPLLEAVARLRHGGVEVELAQRIARLEERLSRMERAAAD